MKKDLIIILSFLMLILGSACVVPGDDPKGDGPELTNIRVTNLDENSVLITWDTSELSDGMIHYGLNSINENYIAEDIDTTLSHSITITSLVPDTIYKYKIVSETMDERFTDYLDNFETIQDTVAPLIIDLRVGSATSSSITMLWETNEFTNCLMYWKEASGVDYTEISSDNIASISHRATITGLTHLTDYHVFVMAIDLSGNDTNSDQLTVSTTDLPDVIWVPETLTVEQGDTFVIGVKLDVEDLVEFCSLVEFDNLMINFLRVQQGPFFIENRGNQWTLDQNTAANHILLSCTWQIDFVGPIPIGTDASGEGIIVYYEFLALNRGETVVTQLLENLYPTPPNPAAPNDTRLIGLFNAEILANWYDCTITIVERSDD